jgi:hypothetical protein
MRWTRRGWRACAAASATATLAACATTTVTDATDGDIAAAPVGVVAAACRLFEPIGWSRADTDATIAAVKAHNAAHDALCAAGSAGRRSN